MSTIVTRLRDAANKLIAGGVFIALTVVAAWPASAVSQRVMNACKADYFRFCASYAPDTAELKTCMSQVGKRLSPGCKDALVASGEIRRSQLARR